MRNLNFNQRVKVDLPPPPVHFWKYAHVFAIQNIWRPEEKFGNWEFINRQIQKYGANHNKDGPKTKVKMKTFLTALSSVLYLMVYFTPYVLYGKHLHICVFPKVNRGGK
jgi:hypothetical protein